MTNDLELVRAQIVRAAEAMLSDRLDLISGCRELARLSLKLSTADRQLFNPIIGFESETDTYPLGEVRRQYSQDYLNRLDQEIAEYTSRSRANIMAACRRIVRELGQQYLPDGVAG